MLSRSNPKSWILNLQTISCFLFAFVLLYYEVQKFSRLNKSLFKKKKKDPLKLQQNFIDSEYKILRLIWWAGYKKIGTYQQKLHLWYVYPVFCIIFHFSCIELTTDIAVPLRKFHNCKFRWYLPNPRLFCKSMQKHLE